MGRQGETWWGLILNYYLPLAQMYLLHFWGPCKDRFQGSLSSKSCCPRPLPGLWNLLTPPKSLQQTNFWPVLQGIQDLPPLRTVPSRQSGEGTFAQGGDSNRNIISDLPLTGSEIGPLLVEVNPNRGGAKFQVCAIKDAQLKTKAEVKRTS
jgi:hypothetical protein